MTPPGVTGGALRHTRRGGSRRVVLEVLWFGAGAAALAASGRAGRAVAFGGVHLVNAALGPLWKQ
ncbi:hypothetical protein PFZ55_24590 [Streptomyces sp. MS2A]|uniref:hypothetical protein n=1 Tax=Streptomyces sp. enrichment culture TaxID=1795815 RepID=UPI0022F0FF2F|nr:hypothetical protein [Streptomyces sp. MS2A]